VYWECILEGTPSPVLLYLLVDMRWSVSSAMHSHHDVLSCHWFKGNGVKRAQTKSFGTVNQVNFPSTVSKIWHTRWGWLNCLCENMVSITVYQLRNRITARLYGAKNHRARECSSCLSLCIRHDLGHHLFHIWLFSYLQFSHYCIHLLCHMVQCSRSPLAYFNIFLTTFVHMSSDTRNFYKAQF
jgi:hypothetical protein